MRYYFFFSFKYLVVGINGILLFLAFWGAQVFSFAMLREYFIFYRCQFNMSQFFFFFTFFISLFWVLDFAFLIIFSQME